MQPTVFVVDDDDAVRDALALLLETAGLVVQCHGSAQDFLDAYAPGQPGCLLLDLRMPGMDGLELQELLNVRGITLPVIFITGHGDVPLSVRALKAGAVDFLEKPADDEELLARIHEAIEQDARSRAMHAERAAICARFERLTPREREVMVLIVAGYSNKQIAQKLDVSYRTVEIHRARIMQKMEAASLPELVNLAAVCLDNGGGGRN